MKDGIRARFDESPTAYDRYEAETGRFAALTERLCEEMAGRWEATPERLLDAGAGTGISSRALEDYGEAVVALDISREMLRQNGASRRVQADFDRLPFADDSFDAVAYTASLFLTPEPAAAVAEAQRVLRPGGVVGAVAPLGWTTADGRDVFETLERDSRSPTGATELEAALASAFAVETGEWAFETTGENVRRFHSIPAIAARLYPRLDTESRVRKAKELLGDVEGDLEQRWQWLVGVHASTVLV